MLVNQLPLILRRPWVPLASPNTHEAASVLTRPTTPLKLSVIIPAYNEESTVGEVIERVLQVNLGTIQKEVIVCDDGSTDSSLAVIERRLAAHSDVLKVHTSIINIGKGAAVPDRGDGLYRARAARAGCSVSAAGGLAAGVGAVTPPRLGAKSRAVTVPIGAWVDCEPPKR